MGSSHNTLYEAVLEALPCEVVVHDGERVVLANAAASHAFGAMSPRSLVGLPLSVLVHPAEDSPSQTQQLHRTGHAVPFMVLPLRFTELGGDTMVIDAAVRGFSVGAHDYAVVVRCRHRLGIPPVPAETPEFSEATSLAQAVLDTLPQPVTVFDNGEHFLFCNQSAQNVFAGADEPRLVGHPIDVVMHPVAREAAFERRRLVLDAGQSFPHLEAKLRRLDGTTLHAICSLGSARLPGGARVGYWIAHAIGDGRLAEVAASA